MNEKEFLDLLRYYFRNTKADEVEEILADYAAHFAEARERGLSDEEIAKELGHPQDIYESYQSEGVVSEKPGMEKAKDKVEAKARETWQEVSPKIPGAAEATASLLVKLFFAVCCIIAVLIVGVTAIILYFASAPIAPFPGAAPLPGMHPLTLIAIGATGLFAALSIFFMGSLGRSFYREKFENPTPPPTGGNPAGGTAAKTENNTPILLPGSAKGGEAK